MDAGATDPFDETVRRCKTDPNEKKQETQDDGYETSNSGEIIRKNNAQTPNERTSPINSSVNNKEATHNMNNLVKSDSVEKDSEKKCDKNDNENDESNELDAETRTVPGSLSNSPKRTTDIENPDDSRSDLSAEASNSQSNSSLGTMKSTQPNFDPNESLNPGLLQPHEDSSSQSHEPQFPDVRAPFNPAEMPPHFLQTQFGAVKREYDGSENMQHMYQYRRDDPYRDMYPKYGMPPYKNEMQYFGNRENEGFRNQFDMYNQVKREQVHDIMYNGIKRECSDDPYSFVDEDAMSAMLSGSQHQQIMNMQNNMQQHHNMMMEPKKRGRKKKEMGMEIKQETGMDGAMMPMKPIKERKKHDRFNGMSEEEVSRRTLPDHLAENLDIMIIGINPGLFAAYKGHHYAGPGNHFWKCLHLSGLTREQMNADDDYKLLNLGIGFTNMVQRATKGSADLTRREIKEGSAVLLEKIQTYRPKVAVFNGKLIYEVFSGKKDFCFGKQPDTVAGTNTYMWVMPSSSARCAQLPRAADKVPFYAALKKFRDYLNGTVHHIEENELVFPDTTLRRPQEDVEMRRQEQIGEGSVPNYTQLMPRAPERLTMDTDPSETMILDDGTEIPLKKKRGRPKKIKLENGEMITPPPPTPRAPRPPKQQISLDLHGEPYKKKRGRPKKIRPEEHQFLMQQQSQMMGQLPPMPGMMSQHNMEGFGQNQDFGSPNLEDLDQSSMMYQRSMNNQSQTLPMGQNSPFFGQPNNQGNGQSIDNTGQLDLSQHSASNQNVLGPMRPYSHSPGYSQSPHGMGYGQSPGPQGYSQSPQRHQTPSYSNSPVPRPAGTPQPSNQIHSPYPSSPAQTPNPTNTTAPFSQTSPQRPQSQNHSYPSPAQNMYSQSPVPQNNPTYSQPQQSPMYANSPAGSAPAYSQMSPASQIGNYSSQSPGGKRFSQSPAPIPYSRSPVPPINQPYSSSPVSVTPFPQQSPAVSNAASVTYSQHNSPVQTTAAANYTSPLQRPFESPSVPPNQEIKNPNPFTSSPERNNPQEYPNDLSTEISAAISSPGPVSPGMGHIDFEPPIAANKIRVSDNEESMGREESSPNENNGSEQQRNESPSLPMPERRPLHSHSALDLIGPPTSSASEHSSQTTFETIDSSSSVRHEQRLGFQVPSASSYGSPAISSPKPEITHPYSFSGEQASSISAASPRLTETTSSVMSPHQIQHPGMYPSPFNRMTPSVLGSQGSPFSSPAFRAPAETSSPTGAVGSPTDYGSAIKPKPQDVAAKSLSGLESLVDQIPSIADNPESTAPAPTIPDYPLYPAYPHYQASYQPNSSYPGLVGYSSPYVMRPTPGYLPDALSYHAGYAGQYGPTAGYNLQQPPNYSYYNGYAPPGMQPPTNVPYLSTHVLDHIHKNADSSVSFGGFC